jgi:hypothetical protein
MAKTSVVSKKKRGPAPTGKGLQVGERWHPSELAAIDAWIAVSSDKTLTRAHAIRRLVALGLSQGRQPGPRVLSTGKEAAALAAEMVVKTTDSVPPKPIGKPGRRARAKELAKDAIDTIVDPTVSPEERDQRRRRLTKGPLEFREDRIDQPKRKR